MTRSTLRRTSAAAVAALALSSLASCGGDSDGDGDEPSSAETSSSSTDEPSESDGAEPSDSEDKSDDAEAGGEEISTDEFVGIYLVAMDQATTATFEMNFGGGMAVKGEGVADFSESPPAMKLNMIDATTKQKQEVIIVDGIMYLRLPDTSYIKYDLNDPNGLLGSDLTDQLDPAAMAEVFEKGITAASYVGEDDVDGEAMEHYRVELDAKALLDGAKLPKGAASDAVAEEVTFDIWFDDDGYFRRQEADLGASAGTVALSYDNWGEPVSIEAPPTSKITELPGA